MIKATSEAAQPFVDAVVEVADQEGWRVHPHYSGRAMYGKTCFALEHDRSSAFDVCAEIMLQLLTTAGDRGDGMDEALHIAAAMQSLHTSQDNISNRWLLYWKEITIVPEQNGEDR